MKSWATFMKTIDLGENAVHTCIVYFIIGCFSSTLADIDVNSMDT